MTSWAFVLHSVESAAYPFDGNRIELVEVSLAAVQEPVTFAFVACFVEQIDLVEVLAAFAFGACFAVNQIRFFVV